MCVCVCVQDVMWLRVNQAHSICLVNSGAKQKRSWMVMGGCSWLTLSSLHFSATDFRWRMKNLKWFRNSGWTWQPYIHTHMHACTGYDEKTLKSRQHLHFFSVNWWSKHDFPTPMSPTKTDKETEMNRALKLVSVLLVNKGWVLLTYRLWCIWKCRSNCTVQWPLWLWKGKKCRV